MFSFDDDDDLFSDLEETSYVDVELLEKHFVVRYDTIVLLKSEVRVDKKTRYVIQDLLDFFDNQNHKPKFLFNSRLIKELQLVVRNNLNSQYQFAGKTGSGKSFLAQKIGFLQTEEYHKYAEELPDDHPKKKEYSQATVHVAFKVDEANNLIGEMGSGDVLIRDEMSKVSGEGSLTEEGANENIRKAVRGKNLNLYNCQPDIVFSGTTNFLFLTIGYNMESEEAVALVYVPFKNTKAASLQFDLCGYIVVKKHDNQEFIDDYEKKKTEYIETLRKNAGTESVSSRPDEIERDAEIVMKTAEEKGIPLTSKEKIKLAIAMSGINTRTTAYQDHVANFIQISTRSAIPEQTEDVFSSDISEMISEMKEFEDPFTAFKPDIYQIVLNSKLSERDKSIFLAAMGIDYSSGELIREKSYPDLATQHNLTHARIQQICTEVVPGSISNQVGHLFEDFTEEYYRQEEGYEIVSRGKYQGEPDLIVLNKKSMVLEVISLKTSMSPRSTIMIFDKCKPELTEWYQRKKDLKEGKENDLGYVEIRLFLEFINLKKDNLHRKIELDEKNLPMYEKQSIALYR